MTPDEDRPFLAPEIVSHYGTGYERERLLGGASRLEFARTKLIVQRYLPPAPARILDVGGGPGAYAAWLARQSYQVQLLDALPLHVAHAREASDRQPDHPFSVEAGDARSMPWEDAYADAVLLLGPLYHLTEREDRLRALREARRVLRPGGVVFGATISRFASLFDGLRYRFVDDPDFLRIVERDLLDGQHRNPNNHLGYFTTAYFHHPEDLRQEVVQAGLNLEEILAVEGPGWLLPNLNDWWEDEQRRERLLQLIAAVEQEPTLLGMSAHLLAVARRPAE